MFGFVKRAVRRVLAAPAPFRVLGDKVLVRRAEAASETERGLLLPDAGGGKPCEGEVVAVGPGTLLANGRYAATAASIGDWVFFGRMAGKEITVDGVHYVVLQDHEVLAALD